MGADMSTKYLQMRFTRSMRYANYKGGIKYDKENCFKKLQKGNGDPEKVECAKFFLEKWKLVESNQDYKYLKKEWKQING
jgi:hypothetical protein